MPNAGRWLNADGGVAVQIQMTDDELYEVLGASIMGGRDMLPDRARVLVRAGRLWFDGQRQRLQEVVCPRLVELQADAGEDKMGLIAAVGDLIAYNLKIVPANTIAILILRIGLHLFCKDFFTRPPSA